MAKQFEDKKVSGQVTLRSRETAKGKSLYLDIYKEGVRSKEYLKMYLKGQSRNQRQEKQNSFARLVGF